MGHCERIVIILLSSSFENVSGGAGRYAQYWFSHFCNGKSDELHNYIIATSDTDIKNSEFVINIERFSLIKKSNTLISAIELLKKQGFHVVLHANSAIELWPYRNLSVNKIVNVNDYDLAKLYSHLFEYALEKRKNRFLKLVSKIIYRELEKKVCKIADVVIANSNYTKRIIDDAYGIESRRVYKSVSQAFRCLDIADATRVSRSVLYVGTDYGRKGIEYIVGNIEKFPLVNFTFVGIDELGAKKLDLPQSAVREGRVKFLSGVCRDEMRRLYASHEFFLLPSKREALGISFLEAMLNECICIGSSVGGVPEIIETGRNGILIPPSLRGVFDGLTQALNLSDEDKMRMRAKGVATAEKFNSDEMLTNVKVIYDSILNFDGIS